MEKLASACFALVLVPAMLLGWLVAAHHLRVWRVRRAFRQLPIGTRARILQRIDAAGKDAADCALLVSRHSPGETPVGADITESRFGGPPYAEAGDQWPPREDQSTEPAQFLIQVRLGEPLPPPWPGRLVVVFLKFDVKQTVRVYETPTSARAIPLSNGQEMGVAVPLDPIRIPKPTSPSEQDGQDNLFVAYDPALLLESVPGLREELAPFSRRPADLLIQIIEPEHYGYALDIHDVVQMGGHPEWLLDIEEHNCDRCEKPLRFLFQFGDISSQHRLGDAGVCYVFGCDEHPDHAQGILQMC